MRYIKNSILYFIIFIITTLQQVYPFNKDIENKIYQNSCFNIPATELDKIERDAFEGDPQASYRLGRFYQYCLGTEYDIKLAGVYYYMARCFEHIGAYRQLNDILIRRYGFEHYKNEYEIFECFTPQELSIFKSRNDLMSNFILYHYYQKKGINALARRYLLLLSGKTSPRFLRNFESIDKEYSIGVPLSQPHIEKDELTTYTSLALSGDMQKATMLMAYYRFGDTDNKKQPHLRNLWAYISYLLGHKESKNILDYYHKKPISDMFVEIKESTILNQADEIYDFVMLNYSRIKNDKSSELKYYEKLKKSDVSEILLNSINDINNIN